MNHMSDGKVQGTKLNLVPSNASATQRADAGATAPTAQFTALLPRCQITPSNVDMTIDTHIVCKNA